MGFFFWLLCIFLFVALVLLLFPFYFKMDFEIGEGGCWARFFFFKKKFYSLKKKWGKSRGCDDEDLEVADKDEDDSCEPAFVDTAPTSSTNNSEKESQKSAESVKKECEAVAEKKKAEGIGSSAEQAKAGNVFPEKAEESSTTHGREKKISSPEPEKKTETAKVAISKSANGAIHAEASVPVSAEKPKATVVEKPPKRKLTERELWTILLTPDLDERAFSYVKRLLVVASRLLRLKFQNCFVEGIRMDYDHMGYAAALNGFLKSYPYIGAWDFRMDWSHEAELRAAGSIHACVNLSRVLGFVVVTLFYSGVLGLCFWFRRKKVLKTGILPELGFIRKKILDFILEE